MPSFLFVSLVVLDKLLSVKSQWSLAFISIENKSTECQKKTYYYVTDAIVLLLTVGYWCLLWMSLGLHNFWYVLKYVQKLLTNFVDILCCTLWHMLHNTSNKLAIESCVSIIPLFSLISLVIFRAARLSIMLIHYFSFHQNYLRSCF